MKTSKLFYIIVTLFVIVAIVSTQCATPQYAAQKSGAQLWAESCIRCHNIASPATFSDTQWDVAVKHMEFRAQLTEEEAKKVLEFIQSAN